MRFPVRASRFQQRHRSATSQARFLHREATICALSIEIQATNLIAPSRACSDEPLLPTSIPRDKPSHIPPPRVVVTCQLFALPFGTTNRLVLAPPYATTHAFPLQSRATSLALLSHSEPR